MPERLAGQSRIWIAASQIAAGGAGGRTGGAGVARVALRARSARRAGGARVALRALRPGVALHGDALRELRLRYRLVLDLRRSDAVLRQLDRSVCAAAEHHEDCDRRHDVGVAEMTT